MSSVVATGEKLILCSGPHDYGPDYKTLDAVPEYKTTYCVTLPPLPWELRQGQFSEIYLIHGIEHFYKWDALALISNVHEALMPGGVFVMEQPNLKTCCEVFLGLREPMTKVIEDSGIAGIFGGPTPFLSHKYGWTPETLRDACISVGFKPENVKTGPGFAHPCAIGRDFRVEATK